MKATVTKVFHFEAAHHLPNHDGKCRLPHGHSYRVEICCTGEIRNQRDDPKLGMVIDFADIKRVWKKELEPVLDHQDLNESIGSAIPATTAEYIAAFICSIFHGSHVPIESVTVWETVTSAATVRYSEVWANGG